MRESTKNSIVGGLAGLIIYETAHIVGQLNGVQVDPKIDLIGCPLFYGYGALIGSYITMTKECKRIDNN